MERSKLMPTGPAAAISADQLLQKAGLYVKRFETAFRTREVTDFWKTGNASCTLLDYFRLGGNVTTRAFISDLYQWFVKEGRTKNLWFDDYLWWAIAAIRGGSGMGRYLTSPWDGFLKQCWQDAQGSLTVWQDAVKKDPEFEKYEPRFDHGVWNASWGPQGPWVDDRWNVGERNVLWGIQNAVVNLLYLNVAGEAAFFDGNFENPAKNEWQFLADWFNPQLTCDSLLYQFAGPSNEQCLLVRERVSSFHEYMNENARDPYFNPTFYWTGDQGLFLGGVITLMNMPASPLPREKCLQYALALINGVRNALVEQSRLLDWKGSPLPQNDTADYISGSGVFLRYALLAWGVPELRQQLKKNGFHQLISTWAAAVPDPPSGTITNDDLNPLTNQLATLLAAVAIQRSPA
jgi:hypothetical protein